MEVTMKHKLEDKTLTIYMEGELNTGNGEGVEREIDKIISQNEFNALVLDMEHLRYLASAGLRIVIRLKQEYDDLSIVKVSEEIYEIFCMVGFQKLMKIEKK